MASNLDPNIQFLEDIPQAEVIIRRFLYYAIYIPPDSTPPSPDIVDQPDLNRYYLDWGRKGDWAVFALLHGDVVGVTWVRLFPADAPGYGTIDPEIPELSIAVHQDYRSRGIGSRLLAAILTRIESQFEAVSLSVAATNPAQHLYGRFGFQVYSQNEKTILMLKRFDSIAPPPNRG